MIVTRFAPSPTGRLHVGNLRTALHNWLLARKGDDEGPGKFLLRIDDTDAERSREEYVTAIREDLAWLGLTPDAEFRQSQRLDLYEDAFAKLKDAGRVYPAYETAQELELKRKIALGRGLPPIYDRAALSMSEDGRAAKEAEGIAPHWRFKLDHDELIAWEDGVRGPQKFDPAQLSDPVIRRADGSWLYMLPSVIDDMDMGVTDVLRGEDHVSNTAVQVQMFTALHAAGVGPGMGSHRHALDPGDTTGDVDDRLEIDPRALRRVGVLLALLCVTQDRADPRIPSALLDTGPHDLQVVEVGQHIDQSDHSHVDVGGHDLPFPKPPSTATVRRL